MKTLLLISLSIASLSVFSAELGEDKKSPCPYAVQTASRDAKEVVVESAVETKQAQKEVGGTSK